MTGEKCDTCGRFMKHEWYLASDEPNDWQDRWACATEHPEEGGE